MKTLSTAEYLAYLGHTVLADDEDGVLVFVNDEDTRPGGYDILVTPV